MTRDQASAFVTRYAQAWNQRHVACLRPHRNGTATPAKPKAATPRSIRIRLQPALALEQVDELQRQQQFAMHRGLVIDCVLKADDPRTMSAALLELMTDLIQATRGDRGNRAADRERPTAADGDGSMMAVAVPAGSHRLEMRQHALPPEPGHLGCDIDRLVQSVPAEKPARWVAWLAC